jgi:hypothetical protein
LGTEYLVEALEILDLTERHFINLKDYLVRVEMVLGEGE